MVIWFGVSCSYMVRIVLYYFGAVISICVVKVQCVLAEVGVQRTGRSTYGTLLVRDVWESDSERQGVS